VVPDDEYMTDTRISALVLYHDASSEYPPRPTKIAPEIEVYQRAVGGLIEAVDLRLPNGTEAVMFVNEEGKIFNLPVNPLATSVARQLNNGFGDQIIVGNAIVVGVKGCDEADVPAEVVAAIHQAHNELRIAGYVQTLRGEQQ
jgi:hypothetical protein